MSINAIAAAAAEHHEVNHNLSWAVGGFALFLLVVLLVGLVVFGGGREHT